MMSTLYPLIPCAFDERYHTSPEMNPFLPLPLPIMMRYSANTTVSVDL